MRHFLFVGAFCSWQVLLSNALLFSPPVARTTEHNNIITGRRERWGSLTSWAVAASLRGEQDDQDNVLKPTLFSSASSSPAPPVVSSSRREALLAGGGAAVLAALLGLPSCSNAAEGTEEAIIVKNDKPPKVLVLGGTGFVGSQVVQILRDQGASVVATSRNGRDGTTALDVTTTNQVQSVVQQLATGCTAVISCIGAIGTTDQDFVINAATAAAAAGAKAASVQRFVYITVAPEIQEFAKDIDFLKGYLQGKAVSRNAVVDLFGEQGGGGGGVLIEPTFIYGGGSFELNPPRVASSYGKLVEGLLTTSPIRTLDRILSPGIIKIALEPPIPVQDVATAAVVGALGRGPTAITEEENGMMILDSYDKIKQAAKLLVQNE